MLAGNELAEPATGRNPAILYGLGNLLENAVDFARERVEVVAAWSGHEVEVTIIDDGPGFAPEIMERIGEPYVTTQRHKHKHHSPGAAGDDSGEIASGLGLGFFIAKTLLERSGAAIDVENRLRAGNRSDCARPLATNGFRASAPTLPLKSRSNVGF